jgi:protein TonB
MLLHTIVLALVVVLPLLVWEGPLPLPEDSIRAFFVTPTDLAAPPPPPPPPPPAGPKTPVHAPAVVRPLEPGRFTAPVLVPDRIEPEPGLDFGVEGGVPGGVEGGVPGGVVGGIVGGLPSEAPPPPPAPVVRVGGSIKEPKVVHRVEPVYPTLALQARLSAMLILEARVDTRGHVVAVSVLRGHPVFDEAAIAALKEWRYQPLLLNGQPTGFILTVTMNFSILMTRH